MPKTILASKTTSNKSPQNDTPQLAAIYARVSTADQADKGYSLPTQIEACLALAHQEGYTVPEQHIFVDDYILAAVCVVVNVGAECLDFASVIASIDIAVVNTPTRLMRSHTSRVAAGHSRWNLP